MRIATLWTHLSGYLNACLRELARIEGVELFVAHMTRSEDAPFEENQFSWLASRYGYDRSPDKKTLLSRLTEFQPEVLLVSSWHISAYRFVLRKLRGKAIRVLAMDNQWRGRWKQWLGVLNSPWYLHALYDAVFLPGERQVVFAKKLGFSERQIVRGLYSCDHEKFAAVHKMKAQRGLPPPEAFIYVGRFTKEKGIQVLAEAYLEYRSKTADPWTLDCCGTGPLRKLLEGVEGVQIHGFVQPDQLPQKFSLASCLVLPSRFEPWGIVIHEATAAGLAVICSSACGASVHLVQDGFNGYIVQPGNPDHLATAMFRYTRLSEQKRKKMAANGYSLSAQFTPRRWATYFLERTQELLQDSLLSDDRA